MERERDERREIGESTVERKDSVEGAWNENTVAALWMLHGVMHDGIIIDCVMYWPYN